MKNTKETLEREKRKMEQEIYEAQAELAAALEGFENVIDPDLVDYYSYSYKATEAKYTYLIKKMKGMYYR